MAVEKVPEIYNAICGVMADIGAVGKTKKNLQQGFMFRGIDDVMNALSPALVKNKVFIVPEVTEEERTERTTVKGGVLFYTRLHITYHFYAVDGSSITAKVIGEAMDSGDKATNKAMSIAYKYAAFQVFNIPTEEMKDPDAEVHEVAAEPKDEIISKKDAEILAAIATKKGVGLDKIVERYHINTLEEMTQKQRADCLKGLNKMPNRVESNLDL